LVLTPPVSFRTAAVMMMAANVETYMATLPASISTSFL